MPQQPHGDIKNFKESPSFLGILIFIYLSMVKKRLYKSPTMTKHSRKDLILIVFLLSVTRLSAQYYSSGSDPASVRWEQINTERFRLVFPDEFKATAIDLAAYLDSMAPHIEATMDHRPGKIDILVHSRSSYSNGFVSWAPKRMELYPNPHQNVYSVDWLKQLTTHEYRHVVQIDKLNQGFTRMANWIFGQQATGVVLGAYLPLWLLEGDAVVTETTLTPSGRGRWPVFSQSLRARLTAYGPDSFDKAYLGSYTDFVPDYYRMGYHLTAALRGQYSPSLWSEVIQNTGRNSWSVTPLRHTLKKTTGEGPRQLYEKVFNDLAHDWQQWDKKLSPSPYRVITEPLDDQTSFEYPEMLANNHIIAEVSGPGQRQRIVEIAPQGDTKTLAYTGIREEEPLAANERWVVWSENKAHLRWPNADYSVLRVWDRNNGKIITLEPKSRYFSPQLKPGSDTLVVVETTPSYHFFITTLRLTTGEVIKRLPTPSNAYPLHPSWSDQPDEIICLLLNDEGKRIVSLNPSSQTWQTLRPPAYDEPRYPVKKGDHLWFSASTPHAEEIFRLDLTTGHCRQVTQARFGATSPTLSADGKTMVYADYTPRGYQLVSVPSMQNLLEQEATPANLTTPLVKKLSEQEPKVDETAQQKDQSSAYKPTPYSKFHLFNLHSWAPVNINLDEEALNPGITLMSQNLLGTAITTVGYNASSSKSSEKYQVGFTWAGWAPVLDLDVKWGDYQRSFDGIYANDTDTFSLQQLGNNGKQLKLETGMRLPLTLNKGPWYRMLQPQARLSWQKVSNPAYQQTFFTLNNQGRLIESGRSDTIQIYRDIDYWAMEYSLYFHNRLRGTTRDAGTRAGQSAELIYRHTPWGNYNAGQSMAVVTQLFFPGLGKHHALRLTNGWEKKINGDEAESSGDIRTYQRFSNLLDLPRGYSSLLSDNVYIFRATYQMPLWNPDASLANLAYIKRLRLNLFFDAARTSYQVDYKDQQPGITYKKTYTSVGWELMADFHLFRFVLPFSGGYRGGFRDGDNTLFHEAVFSTSFGNFLVGEN